MEQLRKHGKEPYRIAVIHGGPGASGEMEPVAKELANDFGVLEPKQTAMSINESVEELKQILEKNGEIPFTLVGYSWGSWLGFIFAANYPDFVKKLILVSSGPFETRYAKNIGETRLYRLDVDERDEVSDLMKVLNNGSVENRNKEFARLGELFSKADAYDPIDHVDEKIELQVDVFQSLWNEASRLRRSGKLLKMGEKIKCPVVAIHGDYDPHPADGVKTPLQNLLKDFRFILLDCCGHKPWIEKQAKDQFYDILKKEL